MATYGRFHPTDYLGKEVRVVGPAGELACGWARAVTTKKGTDELQSITLDLGLDRIELVLLAPEVTIKQVQVTETTV